MNKLVKLLVATTAMTVLMTASVFATEKDINAESAQIVKHVQGVSSAISTVVTFDNNCGEAAKNSMHAHVDVCNKNVKGAVAYEEDNYIKYLQACLGNAIETERTKKVAVDALTDVVKVNPGFQPQLDAAIAEYNKAVVDHAAAQQAIVAAKAQFAALNDTMDASRQAKGAADKDAR